MSTPNRKNISKRNLRIDHRWIAILITIPLLITTITGVLLLLRQQLDWVQPSSLKQAHVVQWATMDSVLDSITHNKHTKIKSWKDISSVIYKPSKGTIQIRTKKKILIQLNGASAQVLSVKPRRTGWLIQLHEGSYWGKDIRRYIFLPAAIGLLFLLISGGILTFKYYKRKWKKRKK